MRARICLLAISLASCGEDGSKGVDGSVAVDADTRLSIDADVERVDGGREFFDAAPGDDGGPSVLDASPIDASNVDASPIDASNVDASTIAAISFFVTSTGSGSSGGNLGGLAGADAKCQSLGAAGGAGGRIWRAYLSTGATGPGPIAHARDRIGAGPWANAQGAIVATDLASLHSSGILGNLVLDQLGAAVPGTEHDILTGTAPDGTLHDDSTTCDNWTDGTVLTQGQVGHSDTEIGDAESWNSQHSGSCDEAALNGNAGTGRLYCFASD